MTDDYPSDEYELIERVRKGESEAFDKIMERYKRPIIDFAYRMLGDSFWANDVAQDVFVRAWRGIDKFEHRADGSFSTWLFQIARNACLDGRRRRSRDPLADPDCDPRTLEQSPAADSVTRNVAARETGRLVAAAVARLPDDQRTVVVLSEYEGLSYKQISAIMHCSVKSVETRLYRARQRLRNDLQDLKPDVNG